MGMIVQVNEDCSYSPGKEFIRDLNVAFAEGDIDFIQKHVSENIVWDFKGMWVIEGMEAFIEEIKREKKARVDKMYLDCIISHDDRASCNGIIYMDDGNEYSFGDFFEFTDSEAKIISKISTYMISTKSGKES